MAEAQNESTSATEKVEKPPKLRWEERQPIFKFLPTSELFRFVSNSVNVLGDYWSHDVREVVSRRGPFYVNVKVWPFAVADVEDDDEEPVNRLFNFLFILEDRSRDLVAAVKHPRLFGDSPLCALTEDLQLPLRWYYDERFVRAVCGAELLAALASSLKSLTLFPNRYAAQSAELCSELVLDFSVFSDSLKEAIWNLRTFQVVGWPLDNLNRVDSLAAFISGMRDLKKFDVPLEVFRAAMPAMVPLEHPFAREDMPHDAGNVLVGLETLHVWRTDPWETDFSTYVILQFISARCRQISDLVLLVGCDISYYLAAFRSLPGLAKLGLSFREAEPNQLIVHQSEPVVSSVKELRLFGNLAREEDEMFAIVAKFPNVCALTIQSAAGSERQILNFVTKTCNYRILPCLQSFKGFAFGGRFHCSLADFQQFIENPNLPRVLDLSQMPLSFKDERPLFLADVYRALARNSVTRLFLKGFDHVTGLPKLREAIAAESGSPANRGKIMAWQDKQYGPPPSGPALLLAEAGASAVTDVKVSGTKQSGPARGEQFSFRLFHPAKPWIGIFE